MAEIARRLHVSDVAVRGYLRRHLNGNRDLQGRDQRTFRFTILERVAPDLPPDEVIAKESSWKLRLHTRAPFGLNAN